MRDWHLSGPATAVLLLFSCLVASGCLRHPQGLTRPEADRAAWWVEDVAHGRDRDPWELADPQGSNGLNAVARWALGTVRGEVSIAAPEPLAARRRRWPLFAAALGNGVLAVDLGGNLVLLRAPDDETAGLLAPALAQEDLDRLATARILCARGNIDLAGPRGRQLLASLAAARREHAQLAGGRPWPEP